MTSKAGTENTSNPEMDNNSIIRNEKMRKALWKYGVPIAGGGACLAAPYLGLWALGFGATGIGSGTVAAAMASKGLPFVATLQSLGAAGLPAGTQFLTFVGGTAASKYVQNKVFKKKSENDGDEDSGAKSQRENDGDRKPGKLKSKL